MRNGIVAAIGLLGLLAAGAAGVAGCAHDRPSEYGDRRPPVDELDPRDRGLQSKDIVQSSDLMAMDLLGSERLNSSNEQWVMVVDHIENRTLNSRFDLDIFLQRLKMNLARHGRGRVQLVENRDRLRELQSRELDGAPRGVRIQPDYSLSGTISELPNRGTSYYLAEFRATDLRTGALAWTNAYEVRVER